MVNDDQRDNNHQVKMRTGVLFSLLCWLLCSQLCSAGDTLKSGKNITQYSENLVSAGNKFELGFFSLPIGSDSTSAKKYLGIWYHNLEPQTVVWVANRDRPVEGSSGVFQIAEDGNVVVADASQNYWSSGLEESSSRNRTVKLLDSGNLVLMDDDHSGMSYLWQSFLHPTDTFLPGMKMDANATLTSWKNDNDPGTGSFTFRLARKRWQYRVYNNSQLYLELDGINSEAMSPLVIGLLANTTLNTSISYKSSGKRINFQSQPYNYEKSRLLMNSTGEIQFLKWADIQWDMLWRMPEDECNIHNYCGNFSSCNKNNDWRRCKCLPGFSPRVINNPRQGCLRKSRPCSYNDKMFLNLTKIKAGSPDLTITKQTEEDCKSLCLNFCSTSECQAYSYYYSSVFDRTLEAGTCEIWARDLPTLQEQQDSGRDVSILVKTSDIVSTAKSCKPCGTYIIPYPLSTGLNCGDHMYNKFSCSEGEVMFNMSGGKLYRVTWIDEAARRFFIQTNDSASDRCDSSSSYQNDEASPPFNVINWCFREDEIEVHWLPAPEPLCNKSVDCKNWPHSTCNATSGGESRCFCNSNYQWNASSLRCTRDRESIQTQEGFYGSGRHVKSLIDLGILEDKDSEGIEVPYYTFGSILAATDNFSNSNKLGQGGYGPVYKGTFPGGQEMAIKRLSSVSTQGLQEFKNEVVSIAKLQHRNLVRLRGYCIKGDEKILLYEYMPNKSLDSFIFGIARGLLYLHQDSRLRVIHRDLKTSNILLDGEMIPKISDFGLAKIFGGKETEASTERVVGTYGYMAPEYALDGMFSMKSDVFSFGVVLLEILSGKRNTGFYQSNQISSLLGYAWRLWTENKLFDLMDPSLGESCNENQFIRCQLIGLLCVQDEPGDRPTMSNVVTMLDSDTATIPIPTQPTFYSIKHRSSTTSSSKPEVSVEFESSYQEGR
ncbi:putative serine/threonine-protein kinase [Sesbania bispinosa]|nr:putative serine/threonine-protein kinase [Sesbania bispinosa]